MTSHYLQEVEELCSYIYVINQGQLVAEGSPDELKKLTRQDRIIRLLVPELLPSVDEALRHVVVQTGARYDSEQHEQGILLTVRHPEDISGQVTSAVVGQGGSLLKLEVVEPSLEDAMLTLSSSLEPSGEVAHVG
ncbi:hypothetical protein [Dictyobacter kobayashii]|uniref:DUF4162 domain-containing protein n=1 Tax=Dictyobacter kobayashii TaxID=2014872 RepID=A0A402AXE9_9CHLR|nr:hypothetical protein [Dictyobacter kobayashii]GCE23734.1 hypothetical protein KDK_75340 [Dictyobacter kobayashii]